MSYLTCNQRDYVTNRQKGILMLSETRLKRVLLLFKTIFFQNHEGHQISTPNKTKAHLFSHEMPMRPVIIQVIS